MKQTDKFDVFFFATLVLFIWAVVSEIRIPAVTASEQESVRDQIEELRHRVELLEKERNYAEAIPAAEELVGLTKRVAGAESIDAADALGLLERLKTENRSDCSGEAVRLAGPSILTFKGKP
jgi:hypothetical protein